MNQIITRDAVQQDFKQIAQISVEAYRQYAEALTPENWSKMAANLANVANTANLASLIVAEENNHIFGSIAYYAPGKSSLKIFPVEWASIRLLAVSPAYRGKGIGQLLVQECIQRAKKDNAPAIGIHTSELMTIARKMYPKMGFQQDKELPSRFGLRYWRYVMNL
ncbi:MAG: GNAT family N-acetyltransferase [Xenococcaceae cyanobacterium MO_188.B29]|nr:GNAT family N-acetyltransferase [Xenococcaceae cyanobacterium MO_188.B29]